MVARSISTISARPCLPVSRSVWTCLRASCAPQRNYRLQSLVANLIASGGALIDATQTHGIARANDAFVRGPVDLQGMGQFLSGEIVPNLRSISAHVRACRSSVAVDPGKVLSALAPRLPRPASPVRGYTGARGFHADQRGRSWACEALRPGRGGVGQVTGRSGLRRFPELHPAVEIPRPRRDAADRAQCRSRAIPRERPRQLPSSSGARRQDRNARLRRGLCVRLGLSDDPRERPEWESGSAVASGRQHRTIPSRWTGRRPSRG